MTQGVTSKSYLAWSPTVCGPCFYATWSDGEDGCKSG